MATAARKVRTRKKRIRPRQAKKGPSQTQIRKAEDMLLVVRDLMIEMEALGVALASEKAELEKHMKKCGIDKVALDDDASAVAEVKAPTQRTSTVIDPQQFYSACSTETDFFNSIQVLVTKAKEVLSGKEIDAISEKIVGEKKPPTLSVKMVKPKKGK